jgi:glutathione S-transferase
MIVVHHLNRSRSTRVLWLLEELELPYELVRYDRDKHTKLAPPALKRIHPLGKSPVIVDDGVVVAESGAILEHVVEVHGHGRLVPTSIEDRRRCRYYMHYAEGSLMPQLVMKYIFQQTKAAVPALMRLPVAGLVDAIAARTTDPNLRAHVTFLDDALKQSTWLAGAELSIADIQMSYAMEALASRTTQVPSSISVYVKRIHDRPAYQRALDKGGPVTLP